MTDFENAFDGNRIAIDGCRTEPPGLNNSHNLLCPRGIVGTENGDVLWHAQSIHLQMETQRLIASAKLQGRPSSLPIVSSEPGHVGRQRES